MSATTIKTKDAPARVKAVGGESGANSAKAARGASAASPADDDAGPLATPTFSLPTKEELLRDYDEERRLRLNNGVLMAFIPLDSFAILVLLVGLIGAALTGNSSIVHAATAMCIISTVLDILFVCSFVAGRRKRTQLATTLTALATAGAIIACESMWTVFQGVDPYAINLFTAFGAAIVLAGVLSDRRTIVVTTLIFNVYSVAYVMIAHPSPTLLALFRQELPIILGVMFVFQWAFAGLLIAAQSGYTRTLSRLGTALYEAEQARQLGELKDLFIRSVNHELRNPIMSVLANVEVLQITMPRATPERRQELATRALKSGLGLRTLLQRILDVRQFDNRKAVLKPVAVPLLETLELAAQLIDPREGNMIERELHLRVPSDLAVWGDPVWLQQILTNLLSNAIKYSPPGTSVEVTAEEVAEEASPTTLLRRHATPARRMVEARVRDHGLGVPPDQAGLLFQKFARLPRDLASKTLGSGLGLALCRAYCEAMGGSIRVESSGVEGEGATFIVRLPMPPGAAA